MSNNEEFEQTTSDNQEVSLRTAHLLERFMKIERPFHNECPIPGMGMAVHCLGNAVKRCESPLDDIVVISGVQCTSWVANHVKVDSFHTTVGRAIPFSTGMKLANPKLKIIVLGVDQDLFSLGGSHFINAARRNVDITVICVNNYDYNLGVEQPLADSNDEEEGKTPSAGSYNRLFNLPFLAEMAGAVYVARWTALHIRKVTDSILDSLNKKGFSFIEILVPCSNNFENDLEGLTHQLKRYYEKCVIQHGANTKEADIGLTEEIRIGRFVDRERLTYHRKMVEWYKNKLGDKYRPDEG